MTNPNQDLLKAATDGKLQMAQEALQKGADIHTKAEYGDTALNNAAEHGHFEVVKFLIDSGADIHNLGGADKTPIMNAAFAGHTNIVSYLIDKGAKVNYDLLSSLQMKVNILYENAEAGYVRKEGAEAWGKFLEYLVGVYKKQNPED